MEGSGSTLGDSPWEGPSGPGSAGAAGLEDQRARNASARRARPGAAVAGRDLRGGPRHRSGAGRGAGGPWRAGGHGPLGGLQVRRPIGAGARLRGDAERDRGGGGRAAEGSPRPNHCGERGSPAPTNAQREGGPAPTNAAEEGEPARTNGLWPGEPALRRRWRAVRGCGRSVPRPEGGSQTWKGQETATEFGLAGPYQVRRRQANGRRDGTYQ